MGGGSANGVFTGWAIVNKTLAVHTILSSPAGWPLLVTPETTKIEPTGAFGYLEGPSGSGAERKGDLTVRWGIPETSEILGDIPHRTPVCQVC